MKKLLLYILSTPLFLISVNPPTHLSFKENLGQVGDQFYKPRPDVLFSGTDGNMNFHLKHSGISYQLYKIEKQGTAPDKFLKTRLKNAPPSNKVSIYRIDINWLNANSNATIERGEVLPDYDNYYSEVCPNGITNVRSYNELLYKNIYSGIDLHYYSNNDHLKYDYIVAPYSDYKQIQLQINGAENISINTNGELIIKTPFGDLIEQVPLVLQNGKQLTAKWTVTNNIVSFDIKNVDPNSQLIIDPMVRVWGTYYGDLNNTYVTNTATDAGNNVCMAGFTDCSLGTAIATSGSQQATFGGGTWDPFLVKFNSNGVRQWGTYYGGSAYDNGGSCAIDPLGNIYLCGGTAGSALSTTGSHQPFYGGGFFDAFLVKFNSNGIRQWATFYGGSGTENGYCCTTDITGNVYLTGWSDSPTTTLVATPSSYQPSLGGGSAAYNAFLVKFNTNGVRQWGTYYGQYAEVANWISIDKSGNIYLAGETSSTISIASPGAHQTSIGGDYDAFLIKFNSTGSRVWCTYYGGEGDDRGHCCTIDSVGNCFILGSTTSTLSNAITSSGCHQPLFGGGANEGDGFIAKFNSAGVRKWGTYYGGNLNDYCISGSTNKKGDIFIGGTAFSSGGTVIATPGSYQPTNGGSNSNVFLTKLDSTGIRQWGTYYGGDGEYSGYITQDVLGSIYLSGTTGTSTGTIIATTGSHQSTFSGNSDGFLVKFFDCNASNGPACVGIEEFESPTLFLNIYPNPNNGDFTIESETEMNLNIVNELGQQVQQLNLNALNNYKANLNNLNAGVYFLTSDKGNIGKKIVVIK